VINHYKMAKHFIVTVTDDDLTFERNVEQAEAEAEAEAELPKRKPKPKPKRIHATKTSADFHLVPLCGAIKKNRLAAAVHRHFLKLIRSGDGAIVKPSLQRAQPEGASSY